MNGLKNMDTNTMRHLSGIKAGIEILVQTLSDVAEKKWKSASNRIYKLCCE